MRTISPGLAPGSPLCCGWRALALVVAVSALAPQTSLGDENLKTPYVMLDPASVQDAYRLTRIAFDLSEATGSPVIVRLVTANASSFSALEVDDQPPAWPERQPVLIRDINTRGAPLCKLGKRPQY